MSIITLTGPALRERARELNIPGRSRMTAGELRTAIASYTIPVTPVTPVTPFRATNGKRKHGKNVRRSRWNNG